MLALLIGGGVVSLMIGDVKEAIILLIFACLFLNDLPLDGRIDGFIKANLAFRPNASTAPLILIGAGAGVAPLMGFLRANRTLREAHLYWGGRSPASDFLYREDLASCMADGRLTALNAVFSRVAEGGYGGRRPSKGDGGFAGIMRRVESSLGRESGSANRGRTASETTQKALSSCDRVSRAAIQTNTASTWRASFSSVW